MDPASAIGIAAASIEFARFTYEFITAVKKLYSSTSGQLLDNETQESLINRMDDLASRTKFNKPLADLSNEERAINEVANECKRISDAIISNLGKIEAKKGKDGKPSLKESIKAAGKGMFAKKDMDQLQKHLNHFMTQLLRQKTVLERYVSLNDPVWLQIRHCNPSFATNFRRGR
jgi:hypothetical protein